MILKQRGSVMLNLPHACFLLLAFSLSSPLAFILYFYPNHHFTPNHRTCLGSPPTPQTKLRIPCYPLSSKKSVQKIPTNPLALCLRSAYPSSYFDFPPISTPLPFFAPQIYRAHLRPASPTPPQAPQKPPPSI